MASVNEKGMAGKIAPEVRMDTSSVSTIASIVGMILATIALGGMRTYWMAALGVVAVGIAQLFEAEMLTSRAFARIFRESDRPFGNGSLSMMTGRLPIAVAGIAVGVISLFGVLTRVLLPVSSILFGLALTFGSRAFMSHEVFSETCEKDEIRAMVRAATRIVGILEIFIGCGSIALGILALNEIGPAPMTLTLVATFGVGFSSLLSSTIFGDKVLSYLHCNKRRA